RHPVQALALALFRDVVELVVQVLAALEGQGGGAELQEGFVLLLEPRVQARRLVLRLLQGGGGGLVGGLRRAGDQGPGNGEGAAGKDRAHGGGSSGGKGPSLCSGGRRVRPCRMSRPAAALSPRSRPRGCGGRRARFRPAAPGASPRLRPGRSPSGSGGTC